MKNTLSVYDPPLCCSSGVCGPAVEPELVRVNADLEWLKTKEIEVNRYNLAQQPLDFTQNETVKTYLQTRGQEALPLLLLNGEILAAGFYPLRDQFASALQLEAEESACCESSGGCC